MEMLIVKMDQMNSLKHAENGTVLMGNGNAAMVVNVCHFHLYVTQWSPVLMVQMRIWISVVTLHALQLTGNVMMDFSVWIKNSCVMDDFWDQAAAVKMKVTSFIVLLLIARVDGGNAGIMSLVLILLMFVMHGTVVQMAQMRIQNYARTGHVLMDDGNVRIMSHVLIQFMYVMHGTVVQMAQMRIRSSARTGHVLMGGGNAGMEADVSGIHLLWMDVPIGHYVQMGQMKIHSIISTEHAMTESSNVITTNVSTAIMFVMERQKM